jgi:hypothetical protein
MVGRPSHLSPNPNGRTGAARHSADGRNELVGHWVYLRTTNPIESTFVCRVAHQVTQSPGLRVAGIAMGIAVDAAAEYQLWVGQAAR